MRPAPAALASMILFSLGAAAQERPSQAACDRGKIAGRAYVECLETAVRAADQALQEAQQRARAAIDARAELAPVQRTRWKNALEEANSAFLAFRNIECQNVAPYEGARGIGAFEERLACLIDKTSARARELDARYKRQ